MHSHHRDHLLGHKTLEAAYADLIRRGVGNTPPLFINQLVHAILRNALDGITNARVRRAGELFFRCSTSISAPAGNPSIEISGDTGDWLPPATVSSSAAISEPSWLDNVRGEPVYLVLAMTRDKLIRMKPQNLVIGLPVKHLEAVS